MTATGIAEIGLKINAPVDDPPGHFYVRLKSQPCGLLHPGIPDFLSEALEKSAGVYNNLFAYPAQSNFAGVQHSLEWIERAHAHGWDVLVDAAAFAPTNQLDLSVYKPDFIPISFYKIFGYPTGIGALIARRAVLGCHVARQGDHDQRRRHLHSGRPAEDGFRDRSEAQHRLGCRRPGVGADDVEEHAGLTGGRGRRRRAAADVVVSQPSRAQRQPI